MRGISKRFIDVVANDAVDFEVAPGEICALLGENGAGKTTLMNILFGYYSYDEGEIEVDGEPLLLRAPRDAIRAGIAMIHQHFTLVPAHTVLENIIIGAGSDRGLFIDRKAARDRILQIQDRFGLHVDTDAYVWTLSVGQQQKVEILKALYRDSQVLIMDEPTGVLPPAEIHDLFSTLRELAAEGRSIVFISHKLREVMEIADRVVVLRNGRNVGQRLTRETDVRELANLMVGREVLERIERRHMEPTETVLTVEELTVTGNRGLDAVRNVSFAVRRHEVLGLAGVSGNGQSELCEAIFGIRTFAGGAVSVRGTRVYGADPAKVVRLGMARIPEDRIGTGLLMDLNLPTNVVLERHGRPPYSNRGLVNHGAVEAFARQLVDDYSIKVGGLSEPVQSMSGGNLQKVILARELSGEPDVVVAAQPTRGLDVGAMEYVHTQILAQKERGAAVLLVSDDLDEIFTLSDRIIVMYEGEIVGEATADPANREQVGLWMSGVVE
ncbi:MAG: ABC transporter ATP-binding protein [Spirochaetaceae bacterium]